MFSMLTGLTYLHYIGEYPPPVYLARPVVDNGRAPALVCIFRL